MVSNPPAVHADGLLPPVRQYVDDRLGEFDQIPEPRKGELERLAGYVRERLEAKRVASLTFVCTHNSRRSHLAQLWAEIAANRYGLDGVETYSGGTEATAFNPRAVKALRRCGLQIDSEDESAANPRYRVAYARDANEAVCFSKRFDDAANPQTDFAAVMTCSDADDHCPTVPGCDFRVAITYDDPKRADGTFEESATYDERTRQISREMLFMVSRVVGS